VKEEYNEIRTFVISSLPYTSENLQIKNCVSAELLRAVIPRGEYTISDTENNIQIRSASGSVYDAYASFDLAVGDYDISGLCTHISAVVSGSANSAEYSATAADFVATYNAVTSTVVFTHTTGEEFDVILDTQLAYTLGFASATFSSSAGGVATGTNRVDLFGNRTVQVTTTEFGGPDGHYKNVLQEIHVADEITLWENTLDPRLTERRFRQPRNVGNLNLSILTRHPSETEDSDYKQLKLNGVVTHLTIVFRCQRYSHEDIQSKVLEMA
jgi:hypothetical protein